MTAEVGGPINSPNLEGMSVAGEGGGGGGERKQPAVNFNNAVERLTAESQEISMSKCVTTGEQVFTGSLQLRSHREHRRQLRQLRRTGVHW